MAGIIKQLINSKKQVPFVSQHVQPIDIIAQELRQLRRSWARSSALALKTWMRLSRRG